MPPGAPVTRTRKCMAPLGFMRRTAGTASQLTHFSMASMVFSSLSPDPVWGSAVGPWGWTPSPPRAPASSPRQPRWAASLSSFTSCPATRSPPTSVRPLPNIWPRRPAPLCCPPWHVSCSPYSTLSSLHPPSPRSSPPRWAPRRGRKAGTPGVCSRRGRRRKKMESTA